jgi:hypothetical protein
MKKVENPLLTEKYTRVYHEDNIEFNAPHHFTVVAVNDVVTFGRKRVVGEVNFQKGAIHEAGVNGVMNEDLIAMIITRLESFQNSEYKCEENATAILHLEAALAALRERTDKRVARGVEGTSEV